MANLMLFMCFDRSSVDVSWLVGKIFENGMLVSIGEYLSSNDLRAVEL